MVGEIYFSTELIMHCLCCARLIIIELAAVGAFSSIILFFFISYVNNVIRHDLKVGSIFDP